MDVPYPITDFPGREAYTLDWKPWLVCLCYYEKWVLLVFARVDDMVVVNLLGSGLSILVRESRNWPGKSQSIFNF